MNLQTILWIAREVNLRTSRSIEIKLVDLPHHIVSNSGLRTHVISMGPSYTNYKFPGNELWGKLQPIKELIKHVNYGGREIAFKNDHTLTIYDMNNPLAIRGINPQFHVII